MANNEIHSYDDVDTSGGRKRRKGVDSRSLGIIIAVVIVGVLLSAAIIIIWYVSFRPSNENAAVLTPVSAPAKETVPKEPVVDAVTESQKGGNSSDQIAQQLDAIQVDTTRTLVQRNGEKSWFRYHTIQAGENLDTIAAMYTLKKETILGINAVKNLSSLNEGVELKIPVMDGRMYTVESGDSLSTITARFNPSLGWKTLQELNDLDSPDIFPGQQLFIPDVRVSEDGSLDSYNRFVSPHNGTISGLYNQTVVYGDSEEIVTLKGIWVRGNLGDPVRASSSGVVVDTAHDVPQMGRFVTLSHENGYRTTYAHLDEVTVAVSDQVKQGDVIGTLGDSGAVTSPTLYFSIEQDGVALDPLNFF
ncbi:MAG: peptidoglycan DD-metalloendopeptidase family protein [Sphaerochaetaceae bacterium]|nr:peptidoglycan DD-metalloendopeptidase family protein [Sphaerochaetaceae bacterium]